MGSYKAHGYGVKMLLLLSLCFHFSHSERSLIWSDEFDHLDETKWTHDVTSYPLEDIHYVRNNRKNSWVEDGSLHIMPTLTADEYGEEFLFSGELDLYEEDPDNPCNIEWDKEHLCYSRSGKDIVKPVQLAKLTSKHKFSFRYGAIEIRAKLPLANWFRPALWLMPEKSVYGGWPASGEVDIMESSGNRDYYCGKDSYGVDWVQTNIHFGPDRGQHWSHGDRKENKTVNYADEFHTWLMDWTRDYIAFSIDGEETYRLTAPGEPGGLFDFAGFEGENIYSEGEPMAPFDQEFYFILSVQSGGWPFYDYCSPPAPWTQGSETIKREFWEARDLWLPTWKQPFTIDYIRVYQ